MSERADLGTRGQAIWDAYGASGLPAGSRALIQEIARSCDLLDQIDELIRGDASKWAEINSADGDITLEINNLLAERRQQQANLQRMLGEARIAGLEQEATGATKKEPEGRAGVILHLRNRANAAS